MTEPPTVGEAFVDAAALLATIAAVMGAVTLAAVGVAVVWGGV